MMRRLIFLCILEALCLCNNAAVVVCKAEKSGDAERSVVVTKQVSQKFTSRSGGIEVIELLENYSFQRLPLLFSPSERDILLEIELHERIYSEKWCENVLIGSLHEFTPPEKVLTEYLRSLKQGNKKKAYSYYLQGEPNQKMKGVMQIVEGMIERANVISFVKSWRFGTFVFVVLDVSMDKSSRTIGLSVREQEGTFFRDDAWVSASGLQMTTVVMLYNHKQGLTATSEDEALKQELFISPPDGVGHLLLHFNGHYYKNPSDQAWCVPNQLEFKQPFRRFFHNFLHVAASGTNEQFISKFGGSELERLNEVQREDTDAVEGIQEQYALDSEEGIKDVLTIDFGEYLVHFYVTRFQPQELKVIPVFRGEVQDFSVTGDFDVNIQMLLESERVRNAVLKAWSNN